MRVGIPLFLPKGNEMKKKIAEIKRGGNREQVPKKEGVSSVPSNTRSTSIPSSRGNFPIKIYFDKLL